MNVDSVELICEKLGTTLDELLPAVISHGLYVSRIWSAIGLIATIVGMYFLFKAYNLNRTAKDYDDKPLIFYIIGLFMLGLGITALGFNLWRLHMWYTAPELTAYKEIASWFRR